jgi:hypothetical protein
LKVTELDRDSLAKVVDILTNHIANAQALNDAALWQILGQCPTQPSVEEFIAWASAVGCVVDDILRQRGILT